ncbi:hypothetical protein B5X24_HaOG210751 [Helicoverpa armigera]|uniref:C2H2-type domain-containing protein n=1 Tax=Helicoverpa armigera TaxID=29058 RepID=A0A2W1BG31_HELAM|nr:hypothetical protein B5X24_HaOG210751 [Helicoverpa armigera]
MSAVGDNKEIWSVSGDRLDSKYEKCRNITEEIYKRINITFQIKKLETEAQSDVSDHSDQIDSNDISNETDLFACDKSDSLSSSTEAEKPSLTCEKYINNNNNEEMKKKTAVVCKRPRKRFRKRVKKRQSRTRSDSEGSSDEALPLSRIVEVDSKLLNTESPDNVMGVPNIVIVTRDLKPKIQTEKKPPAKTATEVTKETPPPSKEEKEIGGTPPVKAQEVLGGTPPIKAKEEKGSGEWKSCTLCSLSFRGERGLRRHMTMSHIINQDETKKSNKPEQREKTTLDG